MVVVVADSILEASRRSGRLNAAQEAFAHQDAQRVIHRLERDGPDLTPYDLGNAVSRDVGLTRNGPHDGQTLRGHLNAALAKEVCRVAGHGSQSRSNL
jgi:hypothetical protein